MSKVPEKLAKARRLNQAYQTYYGPETLVTNAFTRDMAADKVIARRSWFPTIATARWFGSPLYMTKRNNIRVTSGFELKDQNNNRIGPRTKPGSLAKTTNFGYMNNPSNGQDSHTIMYVTIIVLGIVLLSMFI